MSLNNGDTFEALFVPRETKEFRIFVSPDLFDDDLGGDPLNYTFSLKRVPLSEKPIVNEKTNLTDADPIYKNKDSFPCRRMSGTRCFRSS